jgi:hypothetical protein
MNTKRMTEAEKRAAWTKAVNNHVAVGPCANDVERVFWTQAVEAKQWPQLLWFKWDRVTEYQSGSDVSTFNHEGE